MNPPAFPDDAPVHADIEIARVEIGFSSFLRVDIVRFRRRLFSGDWGREQTYEVLRRGDAVGIVLYDPDRDQLVLVEQFRLAPLYAGLSPWQIEVVAGLVEPGEAYDEVARRETAEEANLQIIGDLIPIQRYLPSSGAMDESVMLYCGRVDASRANGIHGVADEHEELRVTVKNWAEVETMIDAGEFASGHTLLAIYWLLRHRDKVRRAWGFSD